MAINFDFGSGAKKSGHLDYPLQSYVGDDGDDNVSNYIQLDAIINPWLVQKRLLPCSRCLKLYSTA